MNTILAKNSSSIGIKKHFDANMELECLGTHGTGDNKLTLWSARTGQEVIETNGAPVFEGESGFAEAREQIMGE